MFEAETQFLLKKILKQLSIEFSSVFNSIRVPLSLMISERNNKRHSKFDYLMATTSDCLFLVKSFLFNNIRVKDIKPIKQRYVVVIDHNREPHINVFLDIIKDIPTYDICIVTINRSVYKRLIGINQYKVIHADNLTTFNLKDVNFLSRVKSEILKIDTNMSIFMRFSVFINLLKVTSYEKVYNKLLSNRINTVLTLCDANLHEQVVTRVANEKEIATSTLQHGVPNILWFPIVSDKFFVWNEHTKRICMDRFGVDRSKIRVSGNPFFEQKKIKIRKNEVFTITYIVTNWGEVENRTLFDVFRKVSVIKGIKLIVKLRPNPSFKMISFYESLINMDENQNIEIIYKDDINNVLSKTNLIVTFLSGVPIDAMAYNIPSILLDIFDYIDLKELMGHYEDCVVVENEEDYIKVVNRIVSDDEYYKSLVEKVEKTRSNYFLSKPRSEVIEEIRSNLFGYQNK